MIGFDARATDLHGTLIDDCFDRFGDFDIVLIAFGVLSDQAVAEQDAAAALDIARINYLGTVSVAVPVSQRLKERATERSWRCRQLPEARSSVNFVYGSSKAGMGAFLQGLGDSLLGTGVRVMIVRPGFVHEDDRGPRRTPLSTTPGAVAGAIVAGLRTTARQCVGSRSVRYVMSALRHVPRPIFANCPYGARSPRSI